MAILRSKRGAGIIDIVIAVFLLGMSATVFFAAFPTSFRCSEQAQGYKIANTIAQRKMEQIRAINFESLNPTLLRSAGVIDADSADSPCSFSAVDSVASQLIQGSGILELSDITDSLKEACITITWKGQGSTPDRSIQLNCYFADKRTRQVGAGA